MTLKEILDRLGNLNPAEIAHRLETEGVKGYVRDPNSCPIANYVARKVETSNVSAGPFYISVFDLANRVFNSATTPHSVAEFMGLFDDGEYPNLIKDDDE